eukprot:6176778-Pleurochrysis_carterae.AAC.4
MEPAIGKQSQFETTEHVQCGGCETIEWQVSVKYLYNYRQAMNKYLKNISDFLRSKQHNTETQLTEEDMGSRLTSVKFNSNGGSRNNRQHIGKLSWGLYWFRGRGG